MKHIEVLGNGENLDSKYNQLYSAILNNEVHDELQAYKLIYQDEKGASIETFKRLKNRLKQRLLNTLFFIDTNQPQFTDIQKAHYTCNRNWLAVKTLLNFGARRTGISIAERTLRYALHYEFTELALYLAKDLRFHYSVVEHNDKKYYHLNQTIEDQLRFLNAEIQAEEHYTQLMRNYSAAQGPAKESLIESAKESSQYLIEQFSDVKTFRFVRISYLVHVTYQQMTFQFEEAINSCYKAISIFDEKPYHSQAARFTFQLRLLSCFIQLKKIDEGKQIVASCIDTLNEGSVNWFITHFYSFLLGSHSKNYQECYYILNTAMSHSKFKTLYTNHKQLWHVNQAYVEFLIQIGKINSKEAEDADSVKFRLYKFLNDVPLYSKDKRGVNVSILVVHVLLLLSQRKFTKIIDRVDALNQYCHRYLKKDNTFRSNCFIKMLLQMARADFNRVRTERYADKYRKKLEAVPLNVASQGIEVEVIPYEDLWEIVLSLLD